MGVGRRARMCVCEERRVKEEGEGEGRRRRANEEDTGGGRMRRANEEANEEAKGGEKSGKE